MRVAALVRAAVLAGVPGANRPARELGRVASLLERCGAEPKSFISRCDLGLDSAEQEPQAIVELFDGSHYG